MLPTPTHPHRFRLSLLFLCALSALVQAEEPLTPINSGGSWVYSTVGTFHDVKADLVQAIESRGIVISYTAHAANMLQRTADAVGALGKTYKNADILLFCKADLTYHLTLKNPHNLSLCPYSVSIYTLATDWEAVYLSIRAPNPSVPEYQPVHDLLVEIVTDTISW
ncbi:MAG: hypothetical protein ACI9GW_001240 [Halieaceae bacterium]|jgi:uncharacterized protein (DUF302 family)